LAFAVAVFIANVSFQRGGGQFYELTSNAKFQKIELKRDDKEIVKSPLASEQYVSVAPIGSRYFVIANYGSLIILDRRNAKICTVAVLGVPKRFNPTGVFYAADGLLYVANYKGNNILRGAVNPVECVFQYHDEYSSSDTGGPENVYVNIRRKILVSANYDAGTVTAFDLADRRQLWVAKISQAHGVTFSGAWVYATGLTDRKIFRLDPSSGQIMASRGEMGWNVGKNQYLWPTTVYAAGRELVVADAHTGFIAFLDPGTLRVTRYMGGNGPTYGRFNYPYAAVPIPGGLVILSTNRRHIVVLDPEGTNVLQEFRFDENLWPATSGEVFGRNWLGYIGVGATPIRVGGRLFFPGYGHLHPVAAGPIFRLPDIDTLYNLNEYIYFVQTVSAGDGRDLVFSSSSRTLLEVVTRPGLPVMLLSHKIPLDSWVVGSAIWNGNGLVGSLADIGRKFERRASVVASLLKTKGWLPAWELYKISEDAGWSEVDYVDFCRRFDSVFVSDEGRRFKAVYDDCDQLDCDLFALGGAAQAYYAGIKNAKYVNIDEYALVGMLSNFVESF